jgi:chorismate synthase
LICPVTSWLLLSEPCFDKLEAKMAHAMLSLPATKGFETGSGFGSPLLFRLVAAFAGRCFRTDAAGGRALGKETR